jgi:hypothetical protein
MKTEIHNGKHKYHIKEESMALKVTTPYNSQFLMPARCAACGSSPAPGLTWKVSGSKSNWSGKRTTTLSLEVPLCQECHDVSTSKGWARFVQVIGVLLAILTCIVMAALVGSGVEKNTVVGLLAGLAGFVLVGWLTVWLAKVINERGFTPEQRERRRKVLKAARIISFKQPGMLDRAGKIVFRFENQAFASEFSGLNGGQVSQ